MEIEQDFGKKDYEVSFLVDKEADVEKMARLLAQHEVEVAGRGPLRRISPAYKIGQAEQVFFGYFTVRAEPQSIVALERDLKTSQAVLRHLVVKLPSAKLMAAADVLPRKPAPILKPRAARPAAPRKPLSNVDLEKKLEEILK